MPIIAVGSKNPVKIKAVENVSRRIWPEVQIISLAISSGVNNQPTSEEEAIRGAITRAQQALTLGRADLGVGLEGYTDDTAHGMFLSGWVAIVDKSGKIGLGNKGKLLLPKSVAEKIKQGQELGPIIDELIGGRKINQKEGAIGVFTKNLSSRQSSFENAIAFALSKFISKELYQ